MATTLTASIVQTVNTIYQTTGAFSTTFSGSPASSFSRSYTSTEITKIYFASLTVTSTPTSLDLTAVTDVFGNSISFATIRQMKIWNKDTSINLTVGGGANGLFAALPFTLTGYTASSGGNGGCLDLAANITVDGTHKILTLTAGSGSITVDCLILGV